MKKIILIFMVSAIFIWWEFESGIVKATTESESSSHTPATNLTGADLTGVNLAGVSLDGVILCNTTMPDGTINNTSCKN
jgi:hypothetical protein